MTTATPTANGPPDSPPGSSQAEEQVFTLPFAPRPAQRVIMDRMAATRFVTAICHRRLGKTLFGVQYLITEALDDPRDDHRGYYFGATQKAAKQVAWSYFKKLLAPLSQAGLVTFRETELQVVIKPNNATITLAGSENIEAYRGIYIDRIVADEVASWANARYAWFEVLRPAMADRYAKGMIIGTVKGLDLLYEFYLRGISPSEDDSDWGAVKLPASLTRIIPAKELAELKRSMSTEAYEREMECNFFAETPEVLISPQEITAAMTRTLSPSLRQASLRAPVILGCDIGRTGDPSVVYRRQGYLMERVLYTQDPDNMSVADRISRLIKLHRPTTVNIDAGQGQGVIDRLRRLQHDDVIVEVPFNSISPEPACVNMRAAMYYRLKNWLARGQLPEDPELLKELANQALVDDPNNRIKLALKKEIRARINRSPNDSDAVALTFADTAADDVEDPEEARRMAIQDYMRLNGIHSSYSENAYDPLDYMDSLTHPQQRAYHPQDDDADTDYYRYANA